MKRTIISVFVGMFIVSMIFLAGCQDDNKITSDKPIPVSPTPAVEKPSTPPTSVRPSVPANPPAVPTLPAKPVQPADTGGRIKVENPIVDLGVMGPNKSYTAQFKFSNIGSGKLIISKVESTCSCSVPDLIKLEYAPGESGIVNVTYHSSAYAGPVEKHLYILSNDSTNPRAEITIKGSTELAVVAEPMKLQLFLNKDNAGAAPINLKSKDGKSFAIQSITSSRNVISVDFDPKVEKTEFVLQPKVNITALKENSTGSLSVRLSHPDCDSVSLVYEALTIYDISRPRIILQNAEPGQTVSRDVYIKNNYNEEFSIASVTCQNNYMKITSQEKQGSSIKLMIDITVPPQTSAVKRYITDKLDIKTSDGELLTIHCSGWYKI